MNRNKVFLLKTTNEQDVYDLELDNSSLETLTSCAKKFQLQRVVGKSPARSSPLNFGGALHEGLAALYSQKGLDKARELTINAFDMSIEPDWRTLDYCLDVLNQYYSQFFIGDSIRPIKIDGQLAVEIPIRQHIFDVEVESKTQFTMSELSGAESNEPLFIKRLRVFYTGRIDLIAHYQGGLYVVDHKTTSILGQTFYDNFILSSQVSGYVDAARHYLNQPVNFLVNAIAVRKPTRTGTPFEVHREPYPISEWNLQEWKHDTVAHIHRVIDGLLIRKFPKSPVWCQGKYGQCPYFMVCSAPPEQRPMLLGSGHYTDFSWNPLES